MIKSPKYRVGISNELEPLEYRIETLYLAIFGSHFLFPSYHLDGYGNLRHPANVPDPSFRARANCGLGATYLLATVFLKNFNKGLFKVGTNFCDLRLKNKRQCIFCN